jgi:outer membrane protein OmpA-like peptidoglycan-associated protein
MSSRAIRISLAAALVCAGTMPALLTAQSTSTGQGSSEGSPSRWDIFAGYSYLAPRGTVNTPVPPSPANPSGVVVADYDAVNVGGLFSGAYYFNRIVGAQVEFAEHEWGVQNGSSNVGTKGNDDGFVTIAGGLIARFPMGNITPFIHGLVGTADVSGPYFNPSHWGPDLTAGGGMDYETPWLNHRLAIRIFQADYEYMHANFGEGYNGGRANVDAARVSAGVVLHIGSIAPPTPVTLACTASPSAVFPGERISITVSAGNLNPKDNVLYTWSGMGVTSTGTNVSVPTDSLAPGSYSVAGTVKEGKTGKEGLKPWETAQCSASFTVKEFEPPTVSCSANPSTLNPGDTATVSATGTSPQNRPLTYSYAASSGSISGTGASATYSSAGAPPGPVDVTCNVADDKGHTATANTSLTIQPPPPPPGPSPEQVQLEARLALHSVFFATAEPRAEHPEGGLLESQQKTLTTLATDFQRYLAFKPDAHLTLTGHADVRGSAEYNQALTQRRVDRAKQFLVEQGIPASAIDTRAVGKEQELSAEQVKGLVEQNPDLTPEQREKTLKQIKVIVLAQNRRVDITLSTTGQQSVQLYPFNAADATTLLEEKAPAPRRKAARKKP